MPRVVCGRRVRGACSGETRWSGGPTYSSGTGPGGAEPTWCMRPARTFMGVDFARSFLSFCSLFHFLSLSLFHFITVTLRKQPFLSSFLSHTYSTPPHALCLFSTLPYLAIVDIPSRLSPYDPPCSRVLWIKFDLVSGRGSHPSVDPFLPPAHTAKI